MSFTATTGATRPVGRFEYCWSSGTWAWDDAMFRLHGLEPARHAPSTETLLAAVDPDDRPSLVATLDNRRMPSHYSVAYRTSSTPSRQLLLVGHATADRGSTPETAGFVTDVTDLLRHREERAVQAALASALEGRDVIEQAKGILRMVYMLSADQAFALLSWWSSNRNVRVRTLAERMVDTVARGDFAQPDLRAALDRLLHDLTTPTESDAPCQACEQ